MKWSEDLPDDILEQADEAGVESMHVVPVDDLKEHETDHPECWCKPQWDYEGDTLIVVHNSLDGREREPH